MRDVRLDLAALGVAERAAADAERAQLLRQQQWLDGERRRRVAEQRLELLGRVLMQTGTVLSPQAAMTNGSLTEMQAISSTPLALSSPALST